MPASAPQSVLNFDIEGDFDYRAASRLADVIRGAGRYTAVHIDFGHAHLIQDAALATLVEALRRADSPVFLDGLGHHQETILRYLGLDTVQNLP